MIIQIPAAPPDSESCCTCASLLHTVPATAPGSEKPLPDPRRLPCCNRIICGSCLHTNARFAFYCPYCQTSTPPLPPRLKSPPSPSLPSDPPPPYSPSSPTTSIPDTKPEPDNQPQPVLHFLDHDHDSITSLSLRYNVPAPLLRRLNNLTSDHLLAARRTLLVPAPDGKSLSPRPVAGELDEQRKAAIRRFMVTCKVADYDVATLYLEQADHNLHDAVEQYLGDDAWERAHPKAKGKTKAEPSSSRRGLFRR